jgi:hypothetical protein
MYPRFPTPYPDGGGALAGGEVRLGRQTSGQGVRLDSLEMDWRRRLGRRCLRWAAAAEQWQRDCGSSDSGGKRGGVQQCAARVASMCPRGGARWVPGLGEPAGVSPAMAVLQRPWELGLWRASCSVRPTRRRVSSVWARGRFWRAQTAMEAGGAMSSPRRRKWRAPEHSGGWACARGKAEDWFLYPWKVGWELVGSRRWHTHAWRDHSMAGDVRRSGGQWRATGGAPAGGLVPPREGPIRRTREGGEWMGADKNSSRRR